MYLGFQKQYRLDYKNTNNQAKSVYYLNSLSWGDQVRGDI